MIRKAVLAVALIAAVCVFAPAATAQAQTFSYGSTCMITLSGPPSGLVTLNGTGFRPNFQTTLTVNGTPATPTATATTSAAGSFTTQINVPPGGVVKATCDTDNSFTTAVLGTTIGTATLSLDKTVVHRLEQFTATLTGAEPGTVVTFFRHSTGVQVGTVTAAADTTAKLTMSFPSDAALGTHEVEATGTTAASSGATFDVSATIEVVADPSSSALPRTGSNSTDLVPFAIGAVAIGGGLVLATRRRRLNHTA
jgi:LPXTG-motif cell wall-anchored protein